MGDDNLRSNFCFLDFHKYCPDHQGSDSYKCKCHCHTQSRLNDNSAYPEADKKKVPVMHDETPTNVPVNQRAEIEPPREWLIELNNDLHKASRWTEYQWAMAAVEYGVQR